jgi:exonuclease III
MRLISWNINGSNDYAKFTEVLNAVKLADFVLLQEVHRKDNDEQLKRWCKDAGWNVLKMLVRK